MLYEKRLLVFVNLILFTVITLALTITPSAFHYGLICFTKLFLCRLSGAIWTAITHLRLRPDLVAVAFVCFSFFFLYKRIPFCFCSPVLDQADHTQYFSPTLLPYHI